MTVSVIVVLEETVTVGLDFFPQESWKDVVASQEIERRILGCNHWLLMNCR